MISDKIFDITAFGELLTDFTSKGINENGQAIFVQNPGGAPANVLVAAQRLGCNTAFIGKVGNDMQGKFLKKVLDDENINTDGLISDNNFFTTLAFVKIDDKTGEREFSFARKPGADTQIKKHEFDLSILDKSKIFHVGSLSLTDEPSRETTYYALEYAKKQGIKISYDPNYRAVLWENENIAKKYIRSILPYTDYLKISDEEITLLTDEVSKDKAAEKLFRSGIKIAVITLGKNGALLYSKFGCKHIEGFSAETVDTTGAGDSFWGGFLSRLSKNLYPTESELEDFVKFGNAAASLCVEKYGAIPAMPALVDVNKKLGIVN